MNCERCGGTGWRFVRGSSRTCECSTPSAPKPDLVEAMPDGSRYLHSEKCEGGDINDPAFTRKPAPAAPATTGAPDCTNRDCILVASHEGECQTVPGWRGEPPPNPGPAAALKAPLCQCCRYQGVLPLYGPGCTLLTIAPTDGVRHCPHFKT